MHEEWQSASSQKNAREAWFKRKPDRSHTHHGLKTARYPVIRGKMWGNSTNITLIARMYK